MPLTNDERLALARHSKAYDAYESLRSDEEARLKEPFAARWEELTTLMGRRPLSREEEEEAKRLGQAISDGLRLFDTNNHPRLDPWDTPLKLRVVIDAYLSYIRSGTTKGLLAPGQTPESLAAKGWDSVFERLMAFAPIAPSVRADFPLTMTAGNTVSLMAARAWCVDATSSPPPAPPNETRTWAATPKSFLDIPAHSDFTQRDEVYRRARVVYNDLLNRGHGYDIAERSALDDEWAEFRTNPSLADVFPFGVPGLQATQAHLQLLDTPLKLDDWLTLRLETLTYMRKTCGWNDVAHMAATGVVLDAMDAARRLGVLLTEPPTTPLTYAAEYKLVAGVQTEVRRAHPYVLRSAVATATPVMHVQTAASLEPIASVPAVTLATTDREIIDTAKAAKLLGVSPEHFTKLAKNLEGWSNPTGRQWSGPADSVTSLHLKRVGKARPGDDCRKAPKPNKKAASPTVVTYVCFDKHETKTDGTRPAKCRYPGCGNRELERKDW